MDIIGTQVTLPFRRAFAIAVRGIRIRLGRSLVTVSGVVLGIAFLMSNLTAQLVKTAIGEERGRRQTVELMMSQVRAEVGTVEGRTVAVAVFGRISETERAFLARVKAGAPATFRAMGIDMDGLTPATARTLGEGAALLFVVGDAVTVSASLGELAGGMAGSVVLDTVASRTFAEGTASGIGREPFFGRQAREEQAEIAEAAREERFRIAWIVAVSLLVTVATVANALLMSVTERFREIGAMKCLGALSAFIRTLFLIESALIGLVGSLLGVLAGASLTLAIYGLTYRFGLIFGSVDYGWLACAAAGAVACGTAMAMIAAIYPARVAARMMPAAALRSTV